MSSRGIQQKQTRRGVAEWSSDEEFQGSEQDWQSDNEWNEDSSLVGEASVMSDGTEEEQQEEETKKVEKRQGRIKKHGSNKPMKMNFDDVGTEDDGESRHLEDITERTDGKYSKNNDASDITYTSDIEDQIAETQNKFFDDKQSLSGVMDLVDEVTTKGETLTKRASETSLVVGRGAFKKGALSNDRLSLFDDDEISFRSYNERVKMNDDHIPQRDLGKMNTGHVEYINCGEKESQGPKQTFGLGHIEYLDGTKSDDSGSLISEQVDVSISNIVVDAQNDSGEENKSETNGKSLAEAGASLSENESAHHSNIRLVKSSESDETLISKISNHLNNESCESNNNNEEECSKEGDDELHSMEQEEENEDCLPDSLENKAFEEPACSKFGEKHLCCFINIGGGGDDGRENELVNRLKKLRDDIANMRKELNLARQECKKESEEVAKLIEAATARNKAAEQNEIALPNSSNILSTYSAPNYTQEVTSTSLLAPTPMFPGRSQVAIPTSLLEERLWATRQNASSTYRKSLNELERMVEKEMASIKDSMTRLEPLNKIAAEWDAVLPIRDPKRTTYKSDYRLEMVTSEMRLQAPDVKTIAVQDK